MIVNMKTNFKIHKRYNDNDTPINNNNITKIIKAGGVPVVIA